MPVLKRGPGERAAHTPKSDPLAQKEVWGKGYKTEPSSTMHRENTATTNFAELQLANPPECAIRSGREVILNAGSGPAFLTARLDHHPQAEREVLAVDISNPKIYEHKVPVRKITADMQKMDMIPTASVDTFFSSYGMEYTDRHRFLNEAKRVTKKGGRIVLILHHPKSLFVQSARIYLRVKSLELLLYREVRRMKDLLDDFDKRRDKNGRVLISGWLRATSKDSYEGKFYDRLTRLLPSLKKRVYGISTEEAEYALGQVLSRTGSTKLFVGEVPSRFVDNWIAETQAEVTSLINFKKNRKQLFSSPRQIKDFFRRKGLTPSSVEPIIQKTPVHFKKYDIEPGSMLGWGIVIKR